eukprot:2168535-Amphidinium_carterae.1
MQSVGRELPIIQDIHQNTPCAVDALKAVRAMYAFKAVRAMDAFAFSLVSRGRHICTASKGYESATRKSLTRQQINN